MAVTFAEMQSAVNDLTKRPELVAVTNLAIRTATLRAHAVDFFPRDRASFALTYTPPTSTAFVDISGLYTSIPLLRTAEFLQSEDTLSLAATENLEYIQSVEQFWDEDNVRRYSVFTQIGDALRCSFAGATGRARLWYYVNPNVSSDCYNSWIADLYKDELAYWAAGIVWARSGFQEQAQQTQMHVTAFKDLLISSHLAAVV